MTYRTDRFEVGDKVNWATDVFYARNFGLNVYGQGPFEIVHVRNALLHAFESVGHTQYVTVNINGNEVLFAGSFFAPINDRPKTLTRDEAIAELEKLREENEKLRQAAIKMQVAVGNVFLYGGTEIDKWFEPLVKCQQELSAQTKPARAEFESYYGEVGRHEVFKD